MDIFNVVRSQINSSLDNQKMSASILKAIEETIEQSGVSPVPAAYFANIITLLQKQLENPRDNQLQIPATMQLLSILMPSLSATVLRSHFVTIYNTIMEVNECKEVESAASDRYTLQCLSFLICAQDGPNWSLSEINQLFHFVIFRTTDARPKVRKAAVDAVYYILGHPPPPLVNHPGCNLLTRFVQQRLQDSEVNKNEIVHLMALMQGCWKFMKSSQRLQVAKAIVKGASRHRQSGMEFSKMLECLNAYANVCSKENDIVNQDFMQTLVALKPDINGVQALASWLSTVVTMSSMNNPKPNEIANIFVLVFSYLKITPNSEEIKLEAHKCLAKALRAIIELIPREMVAEDVPALGNIIDLLNKGLTLGFQSGWSPVFKSIRAMFLRLAQFKAEFSDAPGRVMKDILKTLSNDKVYAQNPHFQFMQDFQEVIGSAILALGPEEFLDTFPLNLESSGEDGPVRSWLLPLLKENIVNARIGFFIDSIVPLSVNIALNGHQLLTAGKQVESKTAAVIWRQLWDLMPSICIGPTDLKQSFEILMTTILPILKAEGDDRSYPILEGLRNLVLRTNQIKSGKITQYLLNAEQCDEYLEYLGSVSHEIFPVLFEKYIVVGSDKPEITDMSMEVIKAWVTVAPASVLNKFFESIVRKYLQLCENEDALGDVSQQKHSIFDLANVMITSMKLSCHAINVLTRIVFMGIKSDDAAIQKKSFRALNNIYTISFNAENPLLDVRKSVWESTEFVDTLCQKIVESLLMVDSCAKKDRLQCINNILTVIDWQRPEQLKMLPSIVTEVILGTKESNEKTRSLAYSTIISLSNKFKEIDLVSNGSATVVDEDVELKINLEEFCKILLAGLAGKTPHMISASIFAISRFLHEYPEQSKVLSKDICESLIHSILIYAEDCKNREIIRAAIGFMKVIIPSYPSIVFAEKPGEDVEMGNEDEEVDVMKIIVTSLINWASQHKSHFRVTCRNLLERLYRKTHGSIESYFPEEHLKLLKNIRKRMERSMKKKSGKSSIVVVEKKKSFEEVLAEDSEEGEASDDDQGDEIPQVLRELVSMRPNKNRKDPMILGESEDIPVDFLDSKMANLMNKDKAAKKRKRKDDFKEEGGKLVIEVENSETEKRLKQLKQANENYMESITSKDSFKRSGDENDSKSYLYLTLTLQSLIRANMTKSYLKYVSTPPFGIISSGGANTVYDYSGTHAICPALEDVFIWNLRQGMLVSKWHDSDNKYEVTVISQSPSSENGSEIYAVGYADGSIRLWSLHTNELILTLNGHKGAVSSLAFDETGTKLISGGKDTDVVLWDILEEKGICRLQGHKDAVTWLSFMNVDGESSHIVSTSKDTLVKVWDLTQKICVETVIGHRSEIWSAALMKNKSVLITGSSDSDIKVFSIDKNHLKMKIKTEEADSFNRESVKPSFTLLGNLNRSSKERVVQIQVDRTGRFIGVQTADKTFELFAIRTDDEIRKKLQRKKKRLEEKEKRPVEVSADVSDMYASVRVVKASAKLKSFDFRPLTSKADEDSLIVLFSLANNSVEVNSISTTSQDYANLCTLDIPGHRTDIRAIALSSDDQLLASAGSKMLKIWNIGRKSCIRSIPVESSMPICCLFLPGNRHVIVGTKGGTLEIYDTWSSTLLESIQAHSGTIWSLDIRPDKQGIVSGSADKEVKFWDFSAVEDLEYSETTRRLTITHMRTLQMPDEVLCVKYSPNQELIAVALLDSTIKVFYQDTLKFFLSLYGHKLPVLSMDISHDNNLLVTGSADKTIKLWGLDFGDCHKSIRAHDDSVMQVRFVPHSHYIFSCSKDKTVKEWDADTNDLIMKLDGHHGEVWGLCVGRWGNIVASAGHDKSIRIWEKTDEQLFLEEEREKEIEEAYEKELLENQNSNKDSNVIGASKATAESLTAAEKLHEAIQIYEDWQKQITDGESPSNPLLSALGNISPELYAFKIVDKLKGVHLEQALWIIPYSKATSLLHIVKYWAENDWNINLTARISSFLVRIHYRQLSASTGSPNIRLLLESLRDSVRQSLCRQKDAIGLNLAAQKIIKKLWDNNHTAEFHEWENELSLKMAKLNASKAKKRKRKDTNTTMNNSIKAKK